MAENTDPNTRNQFALIGAGPMGLAMSRTLLEQGIGFQGFELAPDVGGLWDIDAPLSTMYESAHLISSKTMTAFTDFPKSEDMAEYPPHHEMKTYFQVRRTFRPLPAFHVQHQSAVDDAIGR